MDLYLKDNMNVFGEKIFIQATHYLKGSVIAWAIDGIPFAQVS